MTTKAKPTQGVQFLIGDQGTPTEAFDLVAEVTNFQAPGLEAPSIDVSSLDSSAREFIGGLKDGGEATMDFNFIYDDEGQARLRTRIGQKTNFKITLNDNVVPSTYAFAAVITNVPGVAGGVSEAQKVSGVTLKVTGDVTFTPGAAS